MGNLYLAFLPGLPGSSPPSPHLTTASSCHGNRTVWWGNCRGRSRPWHHGHRQGPLPGAAEDRHLPRVHAQLSRRARPAGSRGRAGSRLEPVRTDSDRLKPFAGLTTGLAYAAGLTVYRGALNPARALGPAFVANRFYPFLSQREREREREREFCPGGTCIGCTGLDPCSVLPVLLSPVMSSSTRWTKRMMMGWGRRREGRATKGEGRETQSTELGEGIPRRLPSASA